MRIGAAASQTLRRVSCDAALRRGAFALPTFAFDGAALADTFLSQMGNFPVDRFG